MITALRIENFKAIGKAAHIDLRPITLIYGANSAGKSTLIHALHYAREIFDRCNLNPIRPTFGGNTVDLGGFERFVHGRDTSRCVSLGFDFALSGLPRYRGHFIEGLAYFQDDAFPLEDEALNHCSGASVDVGMSWNSELRFPFISGYQVGIDGQIVGKIQTRKGDLQAFLDVLNFQHPLLAGGTRSQTFQDVGGKDIELKKTYKPFKEIFFSVVRPKFRATGRALGIPHTGQSVPAWALPHWDGLILDAFNENAHSDEEGIAAVDRTLSRLFCGPGEILRDLLRGLRYIGPMRTLPSRQYEVGERYDQGMWAEGLAAWDFLHSASPEEIDRINHWLVDRLRTGYRVRSREYVELDVATKKADISNRVRTLPRHRRVVLQPQGSQLEVSLADVGMGMSPVLPVVAGSLLAQRKLIAIEQPELHLHPSLQAELGDLFLEAALGGGNNQFLIETHSEHLLLRLMKRMRESAEGKVRGKHRMLSPNDVAVLFVEQQAGSSIVRELPLNERGELMKAWPGGFFEEGLREIF